MNNKRKEMIAALLALSLSLLLVSAVSSEAEVTVIKGGTVIDGTGRPPQPNSIVVIVGDQVKAVGRQDRIPIPPGARVVNADGKYVLPGLIDMHVHYREWQGELFLAHGITTVKDLGNPIEWISELSRLQAEGQLRAPKIFYVGNNLDGPPPEGDHNVGMESLQNAERAVALLFQFNVNAIKVRHKITPEMLGLIARAAHARGIPVTGHLGVTSAADAAKAGIDGLEHASGVALAAAETPDQIKTNVKGLEAFLEDLRGFAQMSPKKEADLLKLLAARKVTLIPTIAVRRRAVAQSEVRERISREEAQMAGRSGLGYVPEAVRKSWREAPLEKAIQQRFGTEEMELMREGYGRLASFVRQFRRAGGVVLAGSDNLNDVPGLSLHRELESLVEAGLTPREALMATTRDAARFLRRNNLGTIEPGKTADLIIVSASPLLDIRNLKTIEKVFQNGREIDTAFNPNYTMPPARPNLTRPLFFERLLTRN